MKLRTILIIAIVYCLPCISRAQYFTIDLQSIAQAKLLNAVGGEQLSSMNNLLQINAQNLDVSKAINTAIGNPGTLNQLLHSTNLTNDLQSLTRDIPGLQGMNINSIFPQGVAGAFLGKTLGEWTQMITNPSSLIADAIRRTVMSSGTPGNTDMSGYITASRPAAGSIHESGGPIEIGFAHMMTAALFDSLKTQSVQQAAYAKKKDEIAQLAENPDNGLIKQGQITNAQMTLQLEQHLNAMQAQNLANGAHAAQLNAQTKVMEDQADRETLDRATAKDH